MAHDGYKKIQGHAWGSGTPRTASTDKFSSRTELESSVYNIVGSIVQRIFSFRSCSKKLTSVLECGPMPNVMAALPNIGGALCSTLQFGWRPLVECRAVKLPRRKTSWNLQGCPKLAKGSQPLVGCKFTTLWGHVEDISLLNKFFPIVYTCLRCEDMARQISAMVPRWRFFASCICSEPRAAHFRPEF